MRTHSTRRGHQIDVAPTNGSGKALAKRVPWVSSTYLMTTNHGPRKVVAVHGTFRSFGSWVTWKWDVSYQLKKTSAIEVIDGDSASICLFAFGPSVLVAAPSVRKASSGLPWRASFQPGLTDNVPTGNSPEHHSWEKLHRFISCLCLPGKEKWYELVFMTLYVYMCSYFREYVWHQFTTMVPITAIIKFELSYRSWVWVCWKWYAQTNSMQMHV